MGQESDRLRDNVIGLTSYINQLIRRLSWEMETLTKKQLLWDINVMADKLQNRNKISLAASIRRGAAIFDMKDDLVMLGRLHETAKRKLDECT